MTTEFVFKVEMAAGQPQREVPADSFAVVAQPGSCWLVFYRNNAEYWRVNTNCVVSMETKREQRQ
jgi:hypothetical protein